MVMTSAKLKVKVRGLSWKGDPTFTVGETHTAKATLTNQTSQALTCTTELYIDVTKKATSGVSSSFSLPAESSMDVSYVVPFSAAGGPWHVYIDVWSGGALLAHYQATEDVTISTPPLVISTTSLPNGYINITYSQTLAASGGSGSYSWSLASGSLCPGLLLSTAGVISGTPTTAGTYTFTVKVSDGISTATQSLSIIITSAIGIGPITWV